MKYKVILFMAFLFLGFNLMAQDTPKSKVVKFKTSAVCDQCKERIEESLNYTKGIIYSELDLDTKVIEVKYKTKFLNAEKVKYLVSQIGYDAGETPRNEEAFSELPKCCQAEGFCKRSG
jgi:copper chaperone CopZ